MANANNFGVMNGLFSFLDGIPSGGGTGEEMNPFGMLSGLFGTMGAGAAATGTPEGQAYADKMQQFLPTVDALGQGVNSAMGASYAPPAQASSMDMMPQMANYVAQMNRPVANTPATVGLVDNQVNPLGVLGKGLGLLGGGWSSKY